MKKLGCFLVVLLVLFVSFCFAGEELPSVTLEPVPLVQAEDVAQAREYADELETQFAVKILLGDRSPLAPDLLFTGETKSRWWKPYHPYGASSPKLTIV